MRVGILDTLLFVAPVDNHVEAGFVFVKCLETTWTAAEDYSHAMNHGLVKVAEPEPWLLFPVKGGKQIETYVERDEFKILSPDNRLELP